MPIMNLHVDTKSLEDIFLQLTEVQEKPKAEKKRFALGKKKNEAEASGEPEEKVQLSDFVKDPEKEEEKTDVSDL